MNNITMIPLDELHNHPKNPRKNIGDIYELTRSIQAKGVMQNLTVVRGYYVDSGYVLDEDYTIVIGHRRAAAAREAGLEEVPCQIVEMDERDQVAAMLLENIQRTDLTAYEQGQGFQMMLDLGEDAASLAKKTGFSQTTIYHRLNIAKLDAETLQEKEEDASFQLSFKDLYELEKIKDIDKRNEILANAKSSSEMICAIDQELERLDREKREKEIEEKLLELGAIELPKEQKYSSNYQLIYYGYIDNLTDSRWEEIEKESAKGEDLYFYWEHYSASTYLYVKKYAEQKPREKTPEEIEEERKREDRRMRHNYIDEMSENIRLKMKSFILADVAPGKITIPVSLELWDEIISVAIEKGVDLDEEEIVAVIVGKPSWKSSDDEKKIAEATMGTLTPFLKVVLNCMSNFYSFANYDCRYRKEEAERMCRIIEILKRHGFVLSSEEQKVLYGTHAYYEEEEE